MDSLTKKFNVFALRKLNVLQETQRRDGAVMGKGMSTRSEEKGNLTSRSSKDLNQHGPEEAAIETHCGRTVVTSSHGQGGGTAWADFPAGTLQATEKWEDIFKKQNRTKNLADQNQTLYLGKSTFELKET